MKKPQNFYWEVLSEKTAIESLKAGNKLFKLFEDSEELIESEHDLRDALELKIEIGIKRLIN